MRPFFGPWHLLLLAEAFAHHFVHRRFHKSRRDRLAVTISLTVIRDQMPVVHDVSPQPRQRLDQWREPGIGLAEGLNRALQVVNLAKRFVNLPVPQGPFQALNLVSYVLTSHRLALHQTFTVLA